MGIQTFDTANIYSNGASEIILGKAIKQFNLPREEIVVMTKVCGYSPNEVIRSTDRTYDTLFLSSEQLAGVVGRTPGEIYYPGSNMEENGYVNQYGLSRKACYFFPRLSTLHHLEAYLRSFRLAFYFIEYLWGSQSELETSSVGLHRFTSM